MKVVMGIAVLAMPWQRLVSMVMACAMYNAATDDNARDMRVNRSLLASQQARQLVVAKGKSRYSGSHC